MTNPGNRRWLVMAVVAMGGFMSTIDSTVVNAIVPELSDYFDSSLGDVDWVVMAYLLAASGLLLAAGRLGDIHGHKRVYLAGFAVFTIASVLCAASTSLEWLIAARLLQGAGGSALYAAGPAVLVLAFPDEQRGRALGLVAISTYGGLSIGPSLGGFVTDHIAWQVVFLVNIPVGIGAIALGWKVISPHEKLEREPFDIAGTLLFLGGLSAFIFSLHEVPQEGWGGNYVLGLFAVSALMMLAFVAVEARIRAPILDLALFRARTFSAGAGSAVINYIGVNAVIFLFPFYFVTYQDYSLSDASLVLTAMPFSMMMTAPFSGWASDKIGSRVLATTGMCGLSIGMILLGLIGNDGGLLVFPPLVIVGISAGLFAPPNNSAIMGSAPKHRQGVAASVLATARNVGLGLGVALASSLFRQRIDDGAVEAFQFVNFTIGGLMLVGALTSSLRGSTVPAAQPLGEAG